MKTLKAVVGWLAVVGLMAGIGLAAGWQTRDLPPGRVACILTIPVFDRGPCPLETPR